MRQITVDDIYSGFWDIVMSKTDHKGLLRKIQVDALIQRLQLRGVEAFIALRSQEEMALIVRRLEEFAQVGIEKKNRANLKRHAYARLIVARFKLLSHGRDENGTSATRDRVNSTRAELDNLFRRSRPLAIN